MIKKRKLVKILIAAALFLAALPLHAHVHKPLPGGIVSVDTTAPYDLKQKIRDGYRTEVSWSDAFGEFVDVDAYVPNLNAEEAYAFIQDIYNLEQWTISVRNLTPAGTLNGRKRYQAAELMHPGGSIYMTEQKYPEVKTVDWWVGETADDIWMHYYVRIYDAQPLVGKPGVVINWVNFGNAKFEKDPGLMQGFLGMRIAHAIERDNLVKILNWRAAGHKEKVTPAIAQQLGLIDIETTAPLDIWNLVMGQITPTVTWDNLYGQFISSHFYVPNKSVDEVWCYLKSPHNMEQWTVSLRDVDDVRGPGFKAHELLEPHGPIFAEMSRSEGSHSLDLAALSGRYTHALGHKPWMNSSMRVIDGMESVGKPGAVVVWTTFRHAAYDQIPELGEYWKYLPVRNHFAAANMKLLLASR
jgi:hypothetical protein